MILDKILYFQIQPPPPPHRNSNSKTWLVYVTDYLSENLIWKCTKVIQSQILANKNPPIHPKLWICGYTPSSSQSCLCRQEIVWSWFPQEMSGNFEQPGKVREFNRKYLESEGILRKTLKKRILANFYFFSDFLIEVYLLNRFCIC